MASHIIAFRYISGCLWCWCSSNWTENWVAVSHSRSESYNL